MITRAFIQQSQQEHAELVRRLDDERIEQERASAALNEGKTEDEIRAEHLAERRRAVQARRDALREQVGASEPEAVAEHLEEQPEHEPALLATEEESHRQDSEGADSSVTSPVEEASAPATSSYTEAEAAELTKLQIVEALLARQGTTPDEATTEANRLMKLLKSELISLLLTEQ